MSNFPDHPDVRAALETGYPRGTAQVAPVCPECGGEAEKFYRSVDGVIVGCDLCIRAVDYWEI